MVRLCAVGVFLWGIYASMTYAWALAPQPEDRSGGVVATVTTGGRLESPSLTERAEGTVTPAGVGSRDQAGITPGTIRAGAPLAESSAPTTPSGLAFAGATGSGLFGASEARASTGVDDPAPAPIPTTAAAAAAAQARAEAAAEVQAILAANAAALAVTPAEVFAPAPTGSATYRPRWESGVYAVGDSPDPRLARTDRDLRPRHSQFTTDAEEAAASDDLELVVGELEPGTYATEVFDGVCRYQLWRVMGRDRQERIIGEDQLTGGRMIVTIDHLEPDWFTATEECGRWRRWAPRANPTTPIINGDYGPGDLAPGTWIIPEGCLWEQVVAFRGTQLHDVVANGRGPARVEVEPELSLGLRLRSCHRPAVLDPGSLDPASLGLHP